MDFTIKQYKQLLIRLQDAVFFFNTFSQYLEEQKQLNKTADSPRPSFPKSPKTVILRHDVDLLPQNSLRFAKIQAKMGIKGSYYFRAVPESWNEDIIKEIAALGHEVGYHYETMDTANGNVDKAYSQFCNQLDKLRKLTDVTTICMHGSPQSKFDNKDIWSKYDYKSLGLVGEPYYDVDFNKVFYLTDTGRCWDGWQTSLRDKVPQQKEWIKQGLVFHSTNDIIKAANENRLPNQIMMTFHPQRWTDKPLPWAKELILQNIKNQVKKVLIKYRNS